MTGAYLAKRLEIETPVVRRPLTPGREIVVHGARENNLQDVSRVVPARRSDSRHGSQRVW